MFQLACMLLLIEEKQIPNLCPQLRIEKTVLTASCGNVKLLHFSVHSSKHFLIYRLLSHSHCTTQSLCKWVNWLERSHTLLTKLITHLADKTDHTPCWQKWSHTLLSKLITHLADKSDHTPCWQKWSHTLLTQVITHLADKTDHTPCWQNWSHTLLTKLITHLADKTDYSAEVYSIHLQSIMFFS